MIWFVGDLRLVRVWFVVLFYCGYSCAFGFVLGAWVGFMLWYCVDCGLDVVYCFDCWTTGLVLVSSGFGFVLLLFVVNVVGGFVWVLWCL